MDGESPSSGRSPAIALVAQLLPSVLVSGVGMLAAGALLDVVQHWPLFTQISELFTLVPALLGLKGNLEMTLASRLSTASVWSKGQFTDAQGRMGLCTANLALVQVQAILVGLAAAAFSVAMGVFFHHEFSLPHALLIASASVATASLASLALGVTMCGIVVLSARCHIDPDNIATPLAACLGDLVTLALLAGVASGLFATMHHAAWVSPLFLLVFLLFVLPMAHLHLRRHPPILAVLHESGPWLAIVLAMVMSSFAGLMLEQYVAHYQGLAVLSPIINGVGGSLGAVLASRMATLLHTGRAGSTSLTPLVAVLAALVVPVSLALLTVVRALHLGHTSHTPMFVAAYCVAALAQVAIVLGFALKFVKFLWKQGLDPDNIAIPYVTAVGDLVGTAFLILTFRVLFLLGDQDQDVGE